MANPAACAVSVRNLEIIKTGAWETQVHNIEKILQKKFKPLMESGHRKIKEIRVLGAVGVIEMNNQIDVALYQKSFVDLGVWVRPFGKLLYIMPPYIISEEDLNHLVDSLISVATDDSLP